MLSVRYLPRQWMVNQWIERSSLCWWTEAELYALAFHYIILTVTSYTAGWKYNQAAKIILSERWAAAHLHKSWFWTAHNWQSYIWCNGWQVSFGTGHIIWLPVEVFHAITTWVYRFSIFRKQKLLQASDLQICILLSLSFPLKLFAYPLLEGLLMVSLLLPASMNTCWRCGFKGTKQRLWSTTGTLSLLPLKIFFCL